MPQSKRKNPVLSSSRKIRRLFAFGFSLALSLSLMISPWGTVAASALDDTDSPASAPGAADIDPDKASDQPFDNVELPQSETLNLLNQAEKLQNHANAPILKGRVISPAGDRRIPILSGSIQNIPPKTEIELVVPPGVFLDSEYSQKGDEVYLRVGKDVLSKDGSKILLPGEWYMRGLVTRTQKRKRGGRDGIIEVEFDKLVSPDHQYELDINASFSTREKKLKTVA
ncbi:MAG TPA: hypothetical protein PKC98_23520, partial [Candidatus Melainabacteria bacterium]|nr:hypothetical protein [Candidatus Melainabacteria bacterium]